MPALSPSPPMSRPRVVPLLDWFAARLPPLGELRLTRAEWKRGHSALTGRWAELAGAALYVWAEERGEYPDDRTIDTAFFAAARGCRVLWVDGVMFR